MKDYYILCIETSGPQCSVALAHNGICISDHVTEDAWHHSQYLTTHIDNCLNKAKINIKQLQAIAVSHGPGSYTGLRVGASTAKGMCYALDLPLISIDTLKIIAYPWADKLEPNANILSTIDARRDEIYFNLYDFNLNELEVTQSHIITPDSFKSYQSNGLIVAGDGAEKTKNIIDQSSNNAFKYHPSYPSAQYMTELAYKKLISNDYEDIAYYSPFYMKPPNITTRKKPLF